MQFRKESIIELSCITLIIKPLVRVLFNTLLRDSKHHDSGQSHKCSLLTTILFPHSTMLVFFAILIFGYIQIATPNFMSCRFDEFLHIATGRKKVLGVWRLKSEIVKAVTLSNLQHYSRLT